MKTIQRLCLPGLAMLWLAACGAKEQDASTPPPVEDTVFGDMVGAMDKARGVQDTTMQHKEELDRALEQQEHADAH